jgi:hypothetical protein
MLKQHETAILDSGCTGNFLLVNAPYLNKIESRTPLTVRLPNGATMESFHTAELDIPEFNADASKAHIFPGMANHSLLSVGQLCDEGYIVTFKQDTVTICDSGNSQILSSPQDLNTGLWRINLRRNNNHKPDPISNNVYELRNTGALVHYLHKLNLIIYFNCACTKPILTHKGRNRPGATIPSFCERGVMRTGYPTTSRPCKYCSMVGSTCMIRFSASSKYNLANSAQHFCPL